MRTLRRRRLASRRRSCWEQRFCRSRGRAPRPRGRRAGKTAECSGETAAARREERTSRARSEARATVRSANASARRAGHLGGRRSEVLARPRRHEPAPVPEALHAARDREQHRRMGGERHRRHLHRDRLPGRRLPQRAAHADHGRAGELPDRPVRQQHLPEGIQRVQRAAVPRRIDRARCRRLVGLPRRLLRGGRRPHRRARGQRPRRQLLRHEQPEHVLVHRGVLLLDSSTTSTSIATS